MRIMIELNKIYNTDCLEFMMQVPNKFFDLVLTDPPYGINIMHDGKSIGGNNDATKLAKVGDYSFANNDWDKEKPKKEYFDEIFRISKNQIIFGANHFIESMPKNSSCWLVWDKDNGNSDFADCELAWTSFRIAVRKYTYRWSGMIQADMRNKEQRVHPTQKPVRLFTAILQDYASSGFKVFDPFIGSGTTAIACESIGLQWCGCERESAYVERANKRLKLVQRDIFGVVA